jgi:hypothetical protein
MAGSPTPLFLTRAELFQFDLRGTALPVFHRTGLSQHVDELRSGCSCYSIRLPGGSDRHPRAVLGSQIPENHILAGILRSGSLTAATPNPAATNASALGVPFRFLDDVRFETVATRRANAS